MARLITLILILLATITAFASCPFTVNCPLDGAQCGRIGTEYSGMVEIGIYGHATIQGAQHSFRVLLGTC